MLQALEIPAEPVAVTEIAFLPETLAALTAFPAHHFTGVLVRATPAEGVELYLNDTGRYDLPGTVAHDGKIGLNLGNGELIAITGSEECRDSIVRDYRIVCAADGSAEITLTESYFGTLYGAMRKKITQMTPELLSRHFQELASGVAQGAAVLEKGTDFAGYPGHVTVRLKVGEFVARSGDFLTLTLPDGGAGALLHTAGRRTVPYWSEQGIDREYRYTVELAELPVEYELSGGEWRWNCPGDAGEITSKRRIDGRIFTLERKIKLAPFYLSAAEYPVVTAAQRLLSADSSRAILVKVTGK